MKNLKFKSANFFNKKKEIVVVYTSGKILTIHYSALGIVQKINNLWIDKETKGKSLVIEYIDGQLDYIPYDQPLHITRDPEYLLQNHIENIIARVKEELVKKNISKKHLARQLETSDNQIQRLLSPNILNKNLVQLYKLSSILGLEFELHLKAA